MRFVPIISLYYFTSISLAEKRFPFSNRIPTIRRNSCKNGSSLMPKSIEYIFDERSTMLCCKDKRKRMQTNLYPQDAYRIDWVYSSCSYLSGPIQFQFTACILQIEQKRIHHNFIYNRALEVTFSEDKKNKYLTLKRKANSCTSHSLIRLYSSQWNLLLPSIWIKNEIDKC